MAEYVVRVKGAPDSPFFDFAEMVNVDALNADHARRRACAKIARRYALAPDDFVAPVCIEMFEGMEIYRD